jgi:ActR/RegA family two-component response regulator
MSTCARIARRVLLVDDDPLIRRVARLTLERAGVALTSAGDLAQARAALDERTFDVAILDYFLGAAECGCDLIPVLRAHCPEVEIVVISGLADLAELVRHAHAAGADRVASKATVDWLALVGAAPAAPSPRVDARVNLADLRRHVIHGTFLVHRRNVSSTARALGMSRSALQRVLRRTPVAEPEDELGTGPPSRRRSRTRTDGP